MGGGYHELQDADELRRRLNADNARRRERGLPEMAPDEALLAAHAHGMPDCAGVALGFDRLVALKFGVSRLAEVMAFPTDRA